MALCVLGGVISEAQDSRLDSDVQIDSMAYVVAMCWGTCLCEKETNSRQLLLLDLPVYLFGFHMYSCKVVNRHIGQS